MKLKIHKKLWINLLIFFSNVGVNLDNNLAHNDNSPLSYIDRNPHSFYLFDVTVDDENYFKVEANSH